jgi:hypothetical protein
MNQKMRPWYDLSPSVALGILSAIAYAGLYGSMVDRFTPVRVSGQLVCSPEYASSLAYAVPEEFLQMCFRPAYEIDKLLRPDYWYHAPQITI